MLARKCDQGEKPLKWYYWLIIAVLVVLGIVCLIPASGTPTNLVGYSSIDPFAGEHDNIIDHSWSDPLVRK